MASHLHCCILFCWLTSGKIFANLYWQFEYYIIGKYPGKNSNIHISLCVNSIGNSRRYTVNEGLTAFTSYDPAFMPYFILPWRLFELDLYQCMQLGLLSISLEILVEKLCSHQIPITTCLNEAFAIARSTHLNHPFLLFVRKTPPCHSIL